MSSHSERAHSKFSASGSERWFNCPGSVELSEGVPDKETEWSKEGTLAHEVLEELMTVAINNGVSRIGHAKFPKRIPLEMVHHGTRAANFILGLHARTPGSDILVETRVYLSFIHEAMFGTFDGAVLDHFGTLHVFDYKYGAGHAVSPVKNLQMIFYGIGLAHLYDWNFKNIRLWIIQPRIRGYDGPIFWDLSVLDLKAKVEEFRQAVERVENNPTLYNEGSWCHWCKAKSKCPMKNEKRIEQAKSIFMNAPLPGREVDFGKGNNGFKEKGGKDRQEKGGEESFEKDFAKGKVKIKEKGVKLIEDDFF